jgi:hypothetical protein
MAGSRGVLEAISDKIMILCTPWSVFITPPQVICLSEGKSLSLSPPTLHFDPSVMEGYSEKTWLSHTYGN